MDELENSADRPQAKKVVWAAMAIGAAIGVGVFFGIVRGDFAPPAERAEGRPPPSAEPTQPIRTASPADSEPHPSTIAPAAGGLETVRTQAPAVPTAPAAGGPAATTTKPASPTAEVAARGRPEAPRFDVVRIAKDRLAVMAGRGPAGSKITLLDGEERLAEAGADGHGEWAVVLAEPMAAGAKKLRLSAELADGRKVESEAPVLVLLPESKGEAATGSAARPTVVRLSEGKGQPSRVLQRPAAPAAAGKGGDAFSLDAVDYDDVGNVVISGSAPDGAAVRLYLDGRPIGAAISGDEKTWRLAPERAIAAGDYTLRLDHLAPDGSVAARLEVPFTRVAARLATRFSPGDRIVVAGIAPAVPGALLHRWARPTGPVQKRARAAQWRARRRPAVGRVER